MKGMLNEKTLTLVFLLLFLTLLVGCFPPPTNQTPIITSSPITAATIGILYTYDVDATDPDGDALTYSLAIKPTGMTINSATGLIKWTPVTAQIGNNSVIVKVSDGKLSITQSFTIKVSTLPTVNQAPVITSVPITTATVGVTYICDVEATDPDGDTLTYSLTTKPSGMVINSTNGLIWWTPTAKGNYAVVVKVSDGVLSDTWGFTIVVSKPTVPPETHTITSSTGTGGTISPLGDVTVDEGKDISFTITPNANYGIEKVLVDGVSVGAVASYTFNNVTKDHTIYATFSAVEPEPEPEVELTGITVSPDTLDLLKGDSQQLTVTAHYSDGSTLNVTSDCVFQSNNVDIASVNSTGTVTANAFGGATITVIYKEEITKTTYIEETDAVEVTVIGPVQNITTGGYYDTIQAAIDKVSNGDTIEVAAGTYYEVGQIVIDKDLTIIGADEVTTIIKPDYDTPATSGYVPSEAWIYVQPGVTFALSEVTLDGTNLTGTPRIIHHAIQSRGELTVEDCIIKNIKTTNIYLGRGIVLLAGTSNTIVRCEFSNIQRIGIHIRGNVEPTNPIAYIEDCTYVGKGDGDWLDYGIEFGGGGSGTVDGCDISACTGVASTDGSISAGVLATDYWGTGTVATVENSTFTGNSHGIYSGYNLDDDTVLTAHHNNFDGNDYGITNGGAIVVDATNNWWGHTSGPTHSTNAAGEGDAVSDNVDFIPWIQ